MKRCLIQLIHRSKTLPRLKISSRLFYSKSHTTAAAMSKKRILFAFDFDHTILNENTDLYICKLVQGGLPAEVKALYTKDNWTNYMCEVFKHVHSIGVGPNEIEQFMKNMEFAPGMKDLCLKIHDQESHDQIIISDSNTVFIGSILQHAGLEKAFKAVFTNPAKFDDKGLLSVAFYHHQDWCSMSTVNMCKGHILSEFLEKGKNGGKTYDHVVYIGDGTNDLCPATRLSENDVLFVRKGYRLEKALENTEKRELVKAPCKFYDHGSEIWKEVETMFE